MFIRGGNANFNKVLVDGIPVNDIGGAFDLGQTATGGRARRGPASNECRGAGDALAGVINITTKRGRTRVPEVEYSIDGGNLDTFATTFSVGGVARHSTTSRAIHGSTRTTTCRTTRTKTARMPDGSGRRLRATPT